MSLRILKPIMNSIAKNMATRAGIVSPVSDRFYFFNFFEKPNISDNAFFDVWNTPSEYIKDKPEFVSLHLHHSKQPDAKHTWVNFVVSNTAESRIFGKGDRDPEWEKMIGDVMKHQLVAYPSGYREISSLKGNPLDGSAKLRSENARFILTAIRVEENEECRENFESAWPHLTGADVIESENGVVDTLLYKRFVRTMPNVFDYVTRTELSGIDDDTSYDLARKINDATQARDRQGVTSFTAAYKIHTNK